MNFILLLEKKKERKINFILLLERKKERKKDEKINFILLLERKKERKIGIEFFNFYNSKKKNQMNKLQERILLIPD